MSNVRISDILARWDGKKSGNGYRGPCPAHGGDNPTALEVIEKDGKVGLHCYSHDCSYEQILRAFGLWQEPSSSDRSHGNRPGAKKRVKASAPKPRAKASEPKENLQHRQRAAQEICGLLTDPVHIPNTTIEAFGCYADLISLMHQALLSHDTDVKTIWAESSADPRLATLVDEVDQGLKTQKEPWRGLLSKTKDGVPRETLGNIVLALQHMDPWTGDCWYDEVRGRFMVGAQPLSDQMTTAAGLALENYANIPIRTRHLVSTALEYLCSQQPRDLLREWLEALPPWDQQPRLTSWLQTYASAPKDAYGQDISRLIPVSMTARGLDPGCQYRSVVILEGPEDAGKSKLVRSLATPEWYRELSHGLEGKEAHMRIKCAWVAELAELSSFGKTEEARLKSFFTLHDDTYIPKFSNYEATHKRRAVFIGTLNPEGDNAYFRGQTGNTRYLPITVRNINIEGFEAIRTQLFAEALRYYQEHHDDWWQLSSEGEYTAKEVREDRRQRSVYEDDLAAWLERTKRLVTWWEELARDYLSVPKLDWRDRRLQMEMARALKALGWEKGKRERMGSDGLIVPWRPGSDWRTHE